MRRRRSVAALTLTVAGGVLAWLSLPGASPGATRSAALLLLLAGLAAGWRAPSGAPLAVLVAAPLLPAAPRLFGDLTGASLLLVFALASLGAALSRRLARGEPSPLPDPVRKWGLAFLAVAAASCVSSILRGETLFLLLRGGAEPLFVNKLWMSAGERNRDAVRMLLVFILLSLAFDAFLRLARDAARRHTLLLAATAAGLLAAAFGGIQRVFPGPPSPSPWPAMERRSGTFTDPNAFGIGLALLVPLLFAAIASREGSTGRALAAGVGLLLSPFALNASGSRTALALLAVAALLAGVGLLRAGALSTRAVTAAAILMAALGAAAWGFLPRGGSVAKGNLVRRLGSALSAASFEDLASHRTLFWRTAFEMIEDEPLSGCGLAAFPYEFPIRYERRHTPVTVTDNATNALLDLGAECGIPALLLALAAVIPLLGQGLQNALSRDSLDPAGRAAGATLIGFAVACLSGSHFRYPEVAVLVSLVAAFALPPERALGASAQEAGPPGPKLVRPVLLASGILASLLVVLPTLKPDTAFRNGPWNGAWGPEIYADGRTQVWLGPRAFRRIQPGERQITLVLRNSRPDGRPVLVTLDVDGGLLQRVTIPAGQSRSILASDLPAAAALRLRFAPTFVPRDLTGRNDLRRLSVVLAGESSGGRA